MLKRLSDWSRISRLELTGDAHGLAYMLHDPYVVIVGVQLPHLLLLGVIGVNGFIGVLDDLLEGSVELLDAQLTIATWVD